MLELLELLILAEAEAEAEALVALLRVVQVL
jgi:hypothetical protein